MKLRVRLALTAIAVTVPVVLALVFFEHSVRSRARAEIIEAATSAQMQSGERERCEASPGSWRGRIEPRPPGGPDAPRFGGMEGERPPPPREPPDREPPPGRLPPEGMRGPPPGGDLGPPGRRAGPPGAVQLFPYDRQFVSSNAQAPALDAELQEAARAGDSAVSRVSRVDGRTVLDVLMHMPWAGGPCEYILARRVEPPDSPLSGMPPLHILGLPALIVLSVVVVAMGSVVQRIRRLTEEVRASASSQYAQPVSVHGRDEIADLARAFQEARREIQGQMARQEQREQALRDFLANTTHDVMTPLTVLQGHLSAMQQRLEHGEPPEPTLMVSAMSEAHYMASLVHNLDAATRLEAGAPQVQRAPVNLNALVSRVLGRHQLIARQQQISLESGVPEEPTWVLGDVTLIEQAVSNVVLNGIRYGRPEGHVAVVLESTRQQRFQLRVIDDGPGITEEERRRLLERRFRGNAARTRAPTGQGLGLNIAHHVVELHGWTLTLAPSEYGGLEVSFAGEVIAPPPPDTA